LSRKKNIPTALNDLLWLRIADVLAEKGLNYSDLRKQVRTNKNTFTGWLKKRTIPQISDLEEIAYVLHVAPEDLLRPSDGRQTTTPGQQLELVFEPGSKGVKLELECTPAGFLLKRAGGSA